MWFNDDQKKGKGVGLRGRSFGSTRRPMLTVNARLKERRSGWSVRIGAVLLVVVACGAATALGWAGVRRAGDVLFLENSQYDLTNVVTSCDNEDLRRYVEGQVHRLAGTNLFAADISLLQTKLAKAASVKSVTISRILPNTLEVVVTERTPVARLGDPRDEPCLLVIDDEGVVFQDKRARSGILSLVTGYGDRQAVVGERLSGRVSEALELLRVCFTTEVGQTFRITAVDVGQKYLRMKLLDGPVVSLAWNTESADRESRARELEQRLKVLRGVQWKYERAGVPLQTVDLTHDNFTEYCSTTPRLDARD